MAKNKEIMKASWTMWLMAWVKRSAQWSTSAMRWWAMLNMDFITQSMKPKKWVTNMTRGSMIIMVRWVNMVVMNTTDVKGL